MNTSRMNDTLVHIYKQAHLPSVAAVQL